ncbi:HAD-IA family hydrolase [Curtobacterium ammoniigenes]|uniref:HAD-IA family hydrolase n=1 Tax=Curtobacterium ammoniigenes TaxID=395387 RepID=UPI000A8DC904|nr:HAD-IA family hydrolase [Curtobacterium ammoniigenes]
MSDDSVNDPSAPTILQCDVVLFDCDGVLVDSDASVLAAWTTWARELGLDPEAVVRTVHGRRSADTVAAWVDPDRRTAAKARIDALELASAGSTTALPGALALLTAIPCDRWAVVTSGTRPLATARLRAAHLPEPAILVTADDVDRGKPAPDGYLRAAAELGADAAHAVVVEDAQAGVRAARAAGVSAVLGIAGGDPISDPVDAFAWDLTAVRWRGRRSNSASGGAAGALVVRADAARGARTRS